MKSRTLKKDKRRKRNIKRSKNKKRTCKKKQKGGMAAIGVGAALMTGVAVAAYAGFRLVNMINDKTIIHNLLQSPLIEYLPITEVIDDKEMMEQYLHCVTKVQLFTLLVEQKELLTSKSIAKLIETVSETDLKLKDVQGSFSEFDKDIVEMKYGNDTTLPLEVNSVALKFNKDGPDSPIVNLSNYVFETAEIMGKNRSICVRNISWYNVIITGKYSDDTNYEADVNNLLERRGSLKFIDKYKYLKKL